MRRWTRKRKLLVFLGMPMIGLSVYVAAYAGMVVPSGQETTTALSGKVKLKRSVYPGFGFPIPVPESLDVDALRPTLVRFFAPIHWLDRRLRSSTWDPANVRWPEVGSLYGFPTDLPDSLNDSEFDEHGLLEAPVPLGN